MQKRVVGPNEAGQRLDKLLGKYLKEAPKSFIYKMLRKKNITLNGKKAEGSEKTVTGDEITLWLSDETIEKFGGRETFKRSGQHPQVIYEDAHILVMNKPAGVLSQKAAAEDVSINEQMMTYLLDTRQIDEATLKSFRPSVTNRLDRNTTGLLVAGKSLAGLQTLSAMFKERKIEKYYYCLVDGVIKGSESIEGWLCKDETSNKVTVVPMQNAVQMQGAGQAFIRTAYEPLGDNGRITLLKVHLITGRTHQIRAHLASEGHPVIGDYKYGKASVNDYFKGKYRLKHQLLHAGELTVPEVTGTLAYLSGKTFKAELPDTFKKILQAELPDTFKKILQAELPDTFRKIL